MGAQFTRSLAEILRSTLQRLEETSDLRQDDNAVIELKKHIVRAIAELEIAKSAHSSESIEKADDAGKAHAPPAPAESDTVAAVGIDANLADPAATPISTPETVVTEPPAETTDVPLLAENGTATAT